MEMTVIRGSQLGLRWVSCLYASSQLLQAETHDIRDGSGRTN